MACEIKIFDDSSSENLSLPNIKDCLLNLTDKENFKSGELRIIFLNDEKIHKMNKEFLEHDYPTDVISFNLDDDPPEGEVYISIDTAERQANEYNVSLSNELLRLAIHGTLHIIGYDDKTSEEKEEMTKLENFYLKGYG